jgi:AraC-like DNA-binding protein
VRYYVAKAVGLSPAYLTDLVRRHTGGSVHKWIIEGSMAEARCLLLKMELSVAQIAVDLNYHDTGHFIQQFRQLHGTTPRAWRVTHQGKPHLH